MAFQIDMFSFGVAVAHYMNDDGNFEFSADTLTSLLESYSYEEEKSTKQKEVKTTQPKKTKKSEFINMDTDDIDVPESWKYCGKSIYLTGNAKDPSTGKSIKTKTFDEAVEKAEELGYQCAGITLTSTGFSLRLSNMERVNPATHYNSGIASWVKTLPPTDPDVDSDVECHGDEQQRAAIAQEKERHEAVIASKADTDVDSDDDDEDDEGLEVIEIDIDGKRYYFDENDSKVYNPTTYMHVGGMNEDGKYYLF